MNQLFDARRWWLLVRKHWSENRKKYLLSLVAITGLMFLWLIYQVVINRNAPDLSLQLHTYYIGLFLTGCLYANTLFADLGSKTKGMNYLAVPASQLEKLFCALFYGLLVFLVCYTAIFYLADLIMVKVGNSVAYAHWQKSHAATDVFEPRKIWNVFYTPQLNVNGDSFAWYLLLFYIVLQAAFIYGSIFFPKFSFIKTVIALLLIGFVAGFIIDKFIEPILPPGNFKNGLTEYQVYTVKPAPSGDGIMIYSDAGSDKLVSLPAWIGDMLFFILKYAFAPLFWLATYYRLKEKEI